MNAHPSIAIVGAGFGGIATAVKLKQAGFHDVAIYELSDGPGGTWRDNTYPGCEVDVPSHAYSFSFMPYDWSRTHARQPELRQYAEDTIDHFGLRQHFHFNTKVEQAVWQPETRSYHLHLSTGETRDFTLLVSALGMLNVPNYPQWPGLESFTRPAFHTARWEHQHDLTGKTVAVVGTGCTAAQIVPEIVDTVCRLYLFQREPGWVLPKGERDFTPQERATFMRSTWRSKWNRLNVFRSAEPLHASFEVGSKDHQAMEQAARDYIAASIDDPELQRLVTPTYPWGCKRPIFATTYYPALNSPNVELIPKAVSHVTRTGVVDVDGVEREIDVLVMATGFKPADYLANLTVIGPEGVSLHDRWAGQPEAFLGITVAGMPNFFIIYGPNTNGGASIIGQLERQAEAVVRTARHMRRSGYKLVDTKREAMQEFVTWVDRLNREKQSAGSSGCHNYYFSPTGRNVTQWPLNSFRYALMTRTKLQQGLTYQR